MSTDRGAFEQAIRAHDQAINRLGMAIWVGAEPTFTDRFSEAPEWLGDARGADKEARARAMLADLIPAFGGGMVLRTVGRQYAREDRPRWSLGLYKRRDTKSIWTGLPDPIVGGVACQTAALEAFWQALAGRLNARGWSAVAFSVAQERGMRIVFRRDDRAPVADPIIDPRLARGSIHNQATPKTGLRDELSEEGVYLVAIGEATPVAATAGKGVACAEMPAFADVAGFQWFLEDIGQAATEANLGGLVLAGYPPPVDHSVAWMTLTPDPGVVEVNMAPAADGATFLAWNRQLFAAADKLGLAPLRLNYNGDVADSGGGGQITLGGPSPEKSPFFVAPQLLPDLIRYCNRHPALSYYWAPDYVGSASQAPRPDEGVRESFEELGVALELLAREQNPQPEIIWRSLAPFLTDAAGNTHRGELNIEKLWNPYLLGRGCLGLVEFRAFRMAATPQAATAVAALLRAIAALLASQGKQTEWVDWGRELHDRFALPFYLRRDLCVVLGELDEAGLGLGPAIVDELLDDDYRVIGRAEFQGCRLVVRRALEFWPLVGDAASQEGGTSRWVDSSTARVEVSLRPLSGQAEELDGWHLLVQGYRVPLILEEDRDGAALIFGLRYRSFAPPQGLHPTLGAHGPLTLTLTHAKHRGALRVSLHDWKPEGGPYEGLPRDLEEARRRRQARFVLEQLADVRLDELPPPASLSDHCLDLRRLAPGN